MTFKRKLYQYAKELLKEGGLGFALLGTGALVFQDLGNATTHLYGIGFVVLGGLMHLASLVLLLFEDIIFEE